MGNIKIKAGGNIKITGARIGLNGFAPAATRLGDNNTGHDACPPVPLASASTNVFINGRGAGRLGDVYVVHSCDDHPPHADVIASGSSTVFINGIPAARIGDTVSLGGSVAEGSGDVFIGG
jgi:uncharacterized Zn-binding protein involved in type VI secretion